MTAILQSAPMEVGNQPAAAPKLKPFALRDAPALIESVFPAQRVSFEAQRERKAGAGQTLTALGSYWKGRKPLILVRAIWPTSSGPRPAAPRSAAPPRPSLAASGTSGYSERDDQVFPSSADVTVGSLP